MTDKKMKTADELIAETKASNAGTSAPNSTQTVNRTAATTNPNAVPLTAVTDRGTATQNYQNTVNAYNKVNATKPAEYQRTFDEQLNSLTDQILNGKKFQFNMETDELYNQYKDMYMKQGKKAAEDTMGQAAALTGGYGNSYATTAANQAYQGYMDQLNDRALDIYDRRYAEYQNNRNDLYNQANLLQNRDSTEYSRYRDTVSDWQSERNLLYSQMIDAYEQGDSERAFEYNKMIDELNRQYQKERDAVADSQWQQEYNYQQQRDAIADSQWQQQFDYNNQVSELNSQIAALEADNAEHQSQLEIANAKDSGNVVWFQNQVLMPIDEFAKYRGYSVDGKRVDGYSNYVNAMAEKYYSEGKLTDAEVAYIKGYYGLN
jgi:hypothetical protein